MALGAPQLAPQIAAIVRALVADPGRAVSGALRDLASAAGAEVGRITTEAQRLVDELTAHAQAAVSEANTLRDRAQAELAQALADLGARVTAAQQAVSDAVATGTQTLESAQQQAQRMRAGAAAASADEIANTDARAQQLVADAQAAADAARQRAADQLAAVNAELARRKAELEAVVTDLTQQAQAAVAEAARLVADAQTRLQAEITRLTAAAQQAAAAVTALPGKAVAMAEDARRQLAALQEPNVSMVGLITQALVWLKNECFPDEQALQVVAYHEPALPTAGVGLSWVQGDMRALVAYVPEMGGPLGALVIETAKAGGGPISLATGSPVRITVSASGNQSTVLTFDAPPAPAGDGSISVAVGFDTSALRVDERFLQAEPGTPNAELTLSSKGGAWHYRAGAQLSGAHWGVDFARLLDPIPNLLPMPGIDERRTFGVTLEDGIFGFTEVNAA
jgi:hypothetical protein